MIQSKTALKIKPIKNQFRISIQLHNLFSVLVGKTIHPFVIIWTPPPQKTDPDSEIMKESNIQIFIIVIIILLLIDAQVKENIQGTFLNKTFQ